jgi:predicted negative regulator of RcsB-dependent stress response
LEDELDIEEGQRAEAAKAFLKRNRVPLIILAVGVLLGAAAGYGYVNWRHSQMLSASQQYSSAVTALEEGRQGDAGAGFRTLIADYGGTPYAAFARVFQARLLHGDGDSEKALEVLAPVAEGADGPKEARHIAVEERARIRWDRQGPADALAELEAIADAAYLPSYFLLKGDLLAALDRPDEARAAFQRVPEAPGGTSLGEAVKARLDRLPAADAGDRE